MRAVVGLAARRPSLGTLAGRGHRGRRPAHRAGAANALLKAVEEPPPRTVFLLCAPSTAPRRRVVTIRSRCRLVTLRTPPADAVAAVLRAPTASTEATAAVGGRRRRRATSAGRGGWPAMTRRAQRRAAVLAIPASLTSLQACFDAADHLVRAAEAEAEALSAELDAGETEDLQVALGAGGTGKGAAAASRGTAGVLKDLEKRQKSRATRTAARRAGPRAGRPRRASTATCCSCRPVRRSLPAHPDFADDVGHCRPLRSTRPVPCTASTRSWPAAPRSS